MLSRTKYHEDAGKKLLTRKEGRRARLGFSCHVTHLIASQTGISVFSPCSINSVCATNQP